MDINLRDVETDEMTAMLACEGCGSDFIVINISKDSSITEIIEEALWIGLNKYNKVLVCDTCYCDIGKSAQAGEKEG